MAPDWILDEDGPRLFERRREIVRGIIATYPGIVRAYCEIRFQIISIRFLEEIAQYLPERGRVVDLGCGFGLFGLYMAQARPGVSLTGIDLNEPRIALANRSARALAVDNARFERSDLRTWRLQEPADVVYALDVFHHLPREAGDELLRSVYDHLAPGGRLLLKEIDTVPRSKALFTYALDKLMAPRDRITYRSAEAWRRQLRKTGFREVACHYMWDVLPYPHVLMVAEK